jgi:hypothetical protein
LLLHYTTLHYTALHYAAVPHAAAPDKPSLGLASPRLASLARRSYHSYTTARPSSALLPGRFPQPRRR